MLCTILVLPVYSSVSYPETPWASTGLPLPRFVSLRSNLVNMRTGPGVRYPVDWEYKRRFMPMEVISEFGAWRKVRDFQGTEGWMHNSMLFNKRYLLVTGQMRTLRSEPNSSTPPIANLEQGAIGEIKQCQEDTGWCHILFGKYRGWLRRAETWGTYNGEKIN